MKIFLPAVFGVLQNRDEERVSRDKLNYVQIGQLIKKTRLFFHMFK